MEGARATKRLCLIKYDRLWKYGRSAGQRDKVVLG